MRKLRPICQQILTCSAMAVLLSSCANMQSSNAVYQPVTASYEADYAARLPNHMNTHGKKMVLVNPNVHAWGAYDKNGNLVRAGVATSGARICPPDAEGEADCRTGSGTYRITSIGGGDCYSKKYPRPNGGGLMPYCMFFNKGQALHGSPDSIVTDDNLSHGCVRMRIPDAEWVSTQFAQVGTKVMVLPYDE